MIKQRVKVKAKAKAKVYGNSNPLLIVSTYYNSAVFALLLRYARFVSICKWERLTKTSSFILKHTFHF
jgi:hypothetical protein